MDIIVNWWLNTLLQWAGCVLVSAPVVFLGAWLTQRNKSPRIVIPWRREHSKVVSSVGVCAGGETARTHTNNNLLVHPWRQMALLSGFLLVALGLARTNVDWVFWRAPWQGMILEAIFALGVILATRSLAQSGVTTPITASGWRASLWMTAGLLGFITLRTMLMRRFELGFDAIPNPEYLLYELTMPGIAEELAYRGVIQSRLNAWLGRPWKILGAQVGWGWVITAVVFWAMHAFTVSSPLQVGFYWPTLTNQIFIGFGLGWIRERSGSVLPAILAHNLVNVLRVVL